MNKEVIKSALSVMRTGDLLEKSKDLLSTLGYRSELTLELSGTIHDFFEEFPPLTPNTKTEQEFRTHAESAQIIFQFTKDEIEEGPQQITMLESSAFDKGNIKSFLFCAVELKDNNYSRTKYAEFTREINKRLFTPTVILFRAGNRLTVAFADRRPDKTDEDRDVLGQVTLIKDIRLNNPHRAHLDILSELSLEECVKWIDEKKKSKNFDGLLAAWLAKLDTEELNKQFYRKLFAWYEWAREEATFPTDENRVIKPAEHVIRLITRLLFIWFIKEKGLVADALFNKSQIQDLLKEDDFDNGDSYYRAVLQNLFFATLNTEIDKRGFSTRSYTTHRNFSRYRYKTQMSDPDKLLELFDETPFINGGLFDCLDSEEATGDGGYRIDCFSDEQYEKLSIPNRLFFDDDQGLIPLLEHYKFTVEENTPIEQEVALDPELLGRVFENLLAAYNPETGATVRKQTGSYYTPRAIVDYMVDEVLVATLSQKCHPTDGDTELWDERLRYLLDYAQMFDDASEWFDNTETDTILKTISELKVLDPAVGSGAFPMGMLHKLTLVLRRLDPDNTRWEKLQKARALQRAEIAFDTQDDPTRREELIDIDETFKRYRDSDFGRKLYLIQNSVFGVDIQSVACQIAKLRFFISLAIEQEPDRAADNFGIKPLPNLETRFISANTLIGLTAQRMLTSNTARDLERELRDNRERHFHATTRQRKREYQRKDEQLRAELATELKSMGTPADDAEKIAQWDPYDQNATADWFDPEWMFGVIDGFDVVIGNPPYIQLQKEGGRLGNLYQDKGFDTFARTGDIYCLFYEKANQLLKNSGYVCFITSNKWMRAGYGKKLRDYFATLTQPIQLLDMGPDVFDATVDTNILLFQKIVSDVPTAFVGVSLGADFDRQTGNIARYVSDNGATMEMLAEGEPWAILSSAELALKRKIENIGKPLKDWDINIYYGIKTGCNEAFIIDKAKREQLIAQDPKSTEIIKPLLRGRDLQRYHAKWQGLWLIVVKFGSYKTFPQKFPAVYEHLIQYEEKLKARGQCRYSRSGRSNLVVVQC
ncbi:MAG: Eco57I restriction-modification methylase domain-containing protein [Candidatus Poribacteria bacterium]|nr:Eco57I restriction-modification methylase domain-containing protein [Candidatus Poribacteria bacterium]